VISYEAPRMMIVLEERVVRRTGAISSGCDTLDRSRAKALAEV
jgi:hypothetical protein